MKISFSNKTEIKSGKLYAFTTALRILQKSQYFVQKKKKLASFSDCRGFSV